MWARWVLCTGVVLKGSLGDEVWRTVCASHMQDETQHNSAAKTLRQLEHAVRHVEGECGV